MKAVPHAKSEIFRSNGSKIIYYLHKHGDRWDWKHYLPAEGQQVVNVYMHFVWHHPQCIFTFKSMWLNFCILLFTLVASYILYCLSEGKTIWPWLSQSRYKTFDHIWYSVEREGVGREGRGGLELRGGGVPSDRHGTGRLSCYVYNWL